MRKRLWLQFHLWTIGLVVILSVANAASALRPFAVHRSENHNLHRQPASLEEIASPVAGQDSQTDSRQDSRWALKTAQVGCEPKQRLKFVAAVRQVRLQLNSCTGKGETVLGIKNATNDFEATLFGAASMTAKKDEAPEGTFRSADAMPAKKPRKPAMENASAPAENISTDYITLAPGENKIMIHRAGRDQILKIERR